MDENMRESSDVAQPAVGVAGVAGNGKRDGAQPADAAGPEAAQRVADAAGPEVAQRVGAGGTAGAAQSAASGKRGQEPNAQPKRARRAWPIVVGVLAVVLVAAGAGFWVWHEQPGFCNAVCHDPMDGYVEGYFGDESLLAHAHQQENVACLDCHEATLDDQITEGIAWVQGDFATDEAGRIVGTGVAFDRATCAKPGCHDFEEVLAKTADWGGEAGVNPHSSHQGEAIDCSHCHVAHGASNMYCNTCHDYEVPVGWGAPGSVNR